MDDVQAARRDRDRGTGRPPLSKGRGSVAEHSSGMFLTTKASRGEWPLASRWRDTGPRSPSSPARARWVVHGPTGPCPGWGQRKPRSTALQLSQDERTGRAMPGPKGDPSLSQFWSGRAPGGRRAGTGTIHPAGSPGPHTGDRHPEALSMLRAGQSRSSTQQRWGQPRRGTWSSAPLAPRPLGPLPCLAQDTPSTPHRASGNRPASADHHATPPSPRRPRAAVHFGRSPRARLQQDSWCGCVPGAACHLPRVGLPLAPTQAPQAAAGSFCVLSKGSRFRSLQPAAADPASGGGGGHGFSAGRGLGARESGRWR